MATMSLRVLLLGCGILCVTTVAACGHTKIREPLAAPTAARGTAERFTFDDLPTGTAPAGFRCAAPGPSDAKPARWEVLAVPDAPSPGNVLVQGDGDDTNNRFPVALVESIHLADVAVAVQARAVSGARDRSFGVVVRAVDERNYYVARANTSTWGENVRFYKFVDGKRSELDEWEGPVALGVWHQLEVVASGATFTISLDGKAVLQVTDTTFTAPGMAGVWTKAESISQFDNLVITPLTSAPSAP